MRLTMKTLSAGPAGTIQPGQTVDVPDEEGRALVRGGYAVESATVSPPGLPASSKAGRPASEPQKEIETAAVEAPAKATTRTGRVRPRRAEG